jgi:transposase-like protein
MDCTTCSCRIPRCPLCGHVAPRAQCPWHDWHRQTPRWRCRACRALVSARTGTASAGIRTEGTPSLRGAVALAEGLSIRATGRRVDGEKDPVKHWLPVLGRHCQSVMNSCCRDLPLRACQVDELWTCAAKKEDPLTPLENRATV